MKSMESVKSIVVSKENFDELSRWVDVVEKLNDGYNILTSKNGVVLKEEFVKFGSVVIISENGAITIQKEVPGAAEEIKKMLNVPEEQEVTEQPKRKRAKNSPKENL